MELREQIQADLKEAMLAKEGEKVTTLRLFFASVQNKEKQKRYEASKKNPNATPQELDAGSQLSLEELLGVLGVEAKKRKEAIEAFEKGQRPEMANKEKRELAILKVYLPTQLTEEEITVLVKDAIVEVGAIGDKDMGKVMVSLLPKTKEKADGSLVNKIVREQLSS